MSNLFIKRFCGLVVFKEMLATRLLELNDCQVAFLQNGSIFRLTRRLLKQWVNSPPCRWSSTTRTSSSSGWRSTSATRTSMRSSRSSTSAPPWPWTCRWPLILVLSDLWPFLISNTRLVWLKSKPLFCLKCNCTSWILRIFLETR